MEMTTGQVARACGVSPDTIRYYERHGAIASRREPNGYRSYPPETVERVKVIRRAIAVGFSVGEIAGFFRERRAGTPPCRKVRAAAEGKLVQIDARIAELRALREQLAGILCQWDARLAEARDDQPSHLLELLPDRIMTKEESS